MELKERSSGCSLPIGREKKSVLYGIFFAVHLLQATIISTVSNKFSHQYNAQEWVSNACWSFAPNPLVSAADELRIYETSRELLDCVYRFLIF